MGEASIISYPLFQAPKAYMGLLGLVTTILQTQIQVAIERLLGLYLDQKQPLIHAEAKLAQLHLSAGIWLGLGSTFSAISGKKAVCSTSDPVISCGIGIQTF